MHFDRILAPDFDSVAGMLGYKNNEPDRVTAAAIEEAIAEVTEKARPRWCWISQPLQWQNGVPMTGDISLPGNDIVFHLCSCTECVLLGVTAGAGVDTLLRQAQASDIQRAVFLDVAASDLVERYACLAEETIRTGLPAGRYMTGRFSPGYGDMPLGFQASLLSMLNAHRMIGLTVNPGGFLLPGKSITALLGVADRPVRGRLAGCETCVLNNNCEKQRKGTPCGQAV